MPLPRPERTPPETKIYFVGISYNIKRQKKMKAVVLNKTGTLADMNMINTAIPAPKEGDKLLQVEYCGINHLDLLIISGKRPVFGQFPLILGSEMTGRISETNEKAAVYPWIFCGKCRQCLEGRENICDTGGTFGRTRDGGFAEYATVPVQNLFKLKDTDDPKAICALTLSAITAYHMINRANIPDKSTVLINGATGGVGTAAIQILKFKKCNIIASTSHPEKSINLIKLGADHTVATKNLSAEISKLMPEGIPYIIDAMGGSVWSESVKLLSKKGTIVFCATTLEEYGRINLGIAFAREINILGSYGGTISDLKEVIKLARIGILKPVIDSEYPLKKVPKALQKLSDQKAFGKILIKVQ